MSMSSISDNRSVSLNRPPKHPINNELNPINIKPPTNAKIPTRSSSPLLLSKSKNFERRNGITTKGKELNKIVNISEENDKKNILSSIKDHITQIPTDMKNTALAISQMKIKSNRSNSTSRINNEEGNYSESSVPFKPMSRDSSPSKSSIGTQALGIFKNASKDFLSNNSRSESPNKGIYKSRDSSPSKSFTSILSTTINIFSHDKDKENNDKTLPLDFQDWNVNDNSSAETETKAVKRLSSDKFKNKQAMSQNKTLGSPTASLDYSPRYGLLEKNTVNISNRSLVSLLSTKSSSGSHRSDRSPVSSSPARKVSFSNVVTVAEFTVEDLQLNSNKNEHENDDNNENDNDVMGTFLNKKQIGGPLQRLRQFDDENIEMQESCCNECKVS